MRPLTEREEEAVLLAISQCAADFQRKHSTKLSAISPEELALFAAHNAATLAPSRSLIRAALGITAEEAADLCVRLRDAAEHVASRQGWRTVLDGFKNLDVAPYRDRV